MAGDDCAEVGARKCAALVEATAELDPGTLMRLELQTADTPEERDPAVALLYGSNPRQVRVTVKNKIMVTRLVSQPPKE